jgi:hypothetical protein
VDRGEHLQDSGAVGRRCHSAARRRTRRWKPTNLSTAAAHCWVRDAVELERRSVVEQHAEQSQDIAGL